MASMRVAATLLLALTLGLTGHVAAQPTPGQELIPLPPCRMADTRGNGFTGGYGPPALIGGASRDFVIAGQCGVPSTAAAVSFNFTVVNATAPSGFLTVYPAGGAVPVAALLQFGPGQSGVVSDSANVLLGPGGVISVYASNIGGTADLIINVYGYFTDTEQLAGQNTAVGASALQNLTTGSQNTAFGAGTLQNNTTGSQNTASGANALATNTTGGSSTASGFAALQSNTIGSDNTASGFGALASNTTGSTNTANGSRALFFNTTGDSNTAAVMGRSRITPPVSAIAPWATGRSAVTRLATRTSRSAPQPAACSRVGAITSTWVAAPAPPPNPPRCAWARAKPAPSLRASPGRW